MPLFMKSGITILCLMVLIACGDEKTEDTSTPSAIDTTQHPNGVTSGSVISTDTAAMKANTRPGNK